MIDKQSKKPEGIGRIIRRDGGFFADRAYKNGLSNGFSRGIWENGDHYIGQCVNGQPDGLFKYFNLKGELLGHKECSKGKLIKEW